MGHSTLDRKGRVKVPKYVQKAKQRERNFEKHKSLNDKLKANGILQAVILILFFALQIVYSFSLVWQSSGMLSITTKNTEYFNNDWGLDELVEYEVYDDGTVSFTTDYDLTFSRRKLDFVFINNTGKDKVYYSSTDNVIVQELPSDYWWVFLKESKYLIVLFASFGVIVFYFIAKNRGWKVFSHRRARVLSIIGAVVTTFAGVLTWIAL